MSDFVTTPTIWTFMQDQAFVRVLAGSVGSGKSVACCHELVKLALQQKPNAQGVRKTRTLIVRNTLDQLRSTTQKTFFDWFPDGVWGAYKITEKTFLMNHTLPDGTKLHAEFVFMPMEDQNDVRKALSLELTFLWCNEWRELHPEVVDGLLMRLRRYPSVKDGGPTRSCAICDTNMPDQDTWHFHKMEDPPKNWSVHIQPPAIYSHSEYLDHIKEEPETAPIEDSLKREWYVNPQADNLANLDPEYYRDIIPGKSEDFIDVYLRCRYGRSLNGLPVYDKTFNAGFHVSKESLSPIISPNYPVYIGQDFGRTPSAIIGQRNVRGQLVVLDELTSNNMGIETFVRTKLKPLLAAKYQGCTFIVAPDPAGFQKQQIGEISMADILKKEGFKVVKPVTNDPEKRIQAVERFLTMNTDGRPAILIDPRCDTLIKGFKYGYRYELNRKGEQNPKPDKNGYSHSHDALQYMCLVVEGNFNPGGYLAQTQRREIKQVNYAWI